MVFIIDNCRPIIHFDFLIGCQCLLPCLDWLMYSKTSKYDRKRNLHKKVFNTTLV